MASKVNSVRLEEEGPPGPVLGFGGVKKTIALFLIYCLVSSDFTTSHAFPSVHGPARTIVSGILLVIVFALVCYMSDSGWI